MPSFPALAPGPRIGLSVLAFVLCWVSGGHVSSAQYASDIYSARAMGMGGAVRTLPTDGCAVDLNPAAMAMFSSYLVDAGYRYYGPQGAHSATLSAVDALTSRVASGFRWELGSADNLPGPEPDGWVVVGDTSRETLHYRGQSYRLGFGFPLHERVLAGATLAWYRSKIAAGDALEDTDFSSKFSLSFGSQVQLTPAVRVALVGTNLIPTRTEAYPTTVAAGVSGLAGGMALAALDLVVDFTSLRDIEGAPAITRENITVNVHVGGQALLAGHIPIRAGFYTERQNGSAYATVGTGIETPRGRIGYALRYRVRGGTGDSAFDGPLTHLFFIGAVIGK